MSNIEIKINFISSIPEICHLINKFSLKSKFLIITDTNISVYYLPEFLKNLSNAISYQITPGEQSKTMKTVKEILNFMFSNNFERKDIIIGLGGGLITDFAGFISSIYMRGIDYISIPTSVLGMVDACIGGKTAVNSNYGKNLIGSFYNPKQIYININFLETLDDRNIANGMAEIIKAALLMDENLFKFLENNSFSQLKNDKEALIKLIKTSIDIKLIIVNKDPKESDIRKLLNLGHTIGHGLEYESHGKLLHGECVSIGLVKEIEISIKLGLITEKIGKILLRRVSNVLEKYNLPIKIPKYINIENVIFYMCSDKKNIDKDIHFVFIKNIAEYYPNSFPVKKELILESLSDEIEILKVADNKKSEYILNDIVSSKSISNRVLFLSALGEGEIEISNFLEADDTDVLIEGLTNLGFLQIIKRESNYLKIKGNCGKTIISTNKITINIKNSGISARFLSSLISLVPIDVILTGDEYMVKRPIKDLLDSLKENIGHEIIYMEKEDYLPVLFRLKTNGINFLKGGFYNINSKKSSQFVSSLLLIAPYAETPITLNLIDLQENEEATSEPYINMTIKTMSIFGIQVQKLKFNQYYIPLGTYKNPKYYKIEPDFTALTYDLIYICLNGGIGILDFSDFDYNFLQYEYLFAKEILQPIGIDVINEKNRLRIEKKNQKLKNFNVNLNKFTDCFMSLAVLASQIEGISRITGISNQRIKECNRILLICENLKKIGVFCIELEDGLEIHGHPNIINDIKRKTIRINTQNDHRIAMSFVALGAYLANNSNIKLIIDKKNCVDKTFPLFYNHFKNVFGINFKSFNKKIKEFTHKSIYLLDKPLFIIGMRNIGKTKLSQLLKKKYNIDYLSIDQLIREKIDFKFDKDLKLFIKEEGWSNFRKIENIIFQEIVKNNIEFKIKEKIVDCGGGIIEDEKNCELFKYLENVIWLESELDLIFDSEKPDFEEEIKEIYQRRKYKYYENSKIIITFPGYNSIRKIDRNISREKYYEIIEKYQIKQFKNIFYSFETHFPYKNNSFFLCLPLEIIDSINLDDFNYITENYDAVELRIDEYYNKENNKNIEYFKIMEDIRLKISIFKLFLNHIPIIITFRYEKPDRTDYNKILKDISKAFVNDIIDIEYDANNMNFLMKFIKHNGNIIISKHYFDSTTKEKEILYDVKLILSFISLFSSSCIKMIKICLPENISDEFVFKIKKKIITNVKIECLIFKLGNLGKLSRLQSNFMCPVYDDKFSQKMAEGQLTKKEIEEARKFILFENENKNFHIIGNNIQYSLSPKVYNQIFKNYGYLNNNYSLKGDFKSEKELFEFLENKKFEGLSVTIPYKKTVIEKIEGKIGIAKEINVVNTILNINGKLWGFNTDWYGIYKPLLNILSFKNKFNFMGLILGSGATSQTAFYVLNKIFGIRCIILSRNENNFGYFIKQNAEKNLLFYSIEKLKDFILKNENEYIIFNSIPPKENCPLSQLSLESKSKIFNENSILFDASYIEGNFLIEGKKFCCKNIISGLEMFIGQAKKQSQLFTFKKIQSKMISQILNEK